MTVIADYVTVTTPIGNGPHLREDLTDVCLQLPEAETDPLGVRVGKFGLLRVADQYGVTIASCSGVVLAALRASNLLEAYCHAVAAQVQHKVTRIEIAHDELCDVPAVLAHRYSMLRIAGVNLTRKRIPPEKIKCLFGRGPDGRDTGSIMMGHRKAHRVSAIMYDRAEDARAKGKPDPGSLLRTELRLAVDGMTLRDVLDPAPLFYEFASPGLFPRPDGVAQWQPQGEGFQLERKEVDHQARLRRLVENSHDLGAMLDLSAKLPGEGLDVLLRLIRMRAKVRTATNAFTTGSGAKHEGEARPPSDDTPHN